MIVELSDRRRRALQIATPIVQLCLEIVYAIGEIFDLVLEMSRVNSLLPGLVYEVVCLLANRLQRFFQARSFFS